MDIDKRNKIIMDCEEVVDEILHKEGYVFDHKKIRDKIRELLDENLTKHNSSSKKELKEMLSEAEELKKASKECKAELKRLFNI